MSQPECTRFGRRIKQTAKFQEGNSQRTPNRKAAGETGSVQTPDQDMMQRTNSVDDLVSPMTAAPATGLPSVSQQRPMASVADQQLLPTPNASSSTAATPVGASSPRRAEKRGDSGVGVTLPHSQAEASTEGSSVATGHNTVRRPQASKSNTRDWEAIEKRWNEQQKKKGIQKKKPPPPGPTRAENEAKWQAAAQANPLIQKLRQESAALDAEMEPADESHTVRSPATGAQVDEASTERAQGREQPTGYARNRYGDMEPLYGGETHLPNGVQSHTSSVPGTRGDWKKGSKYPGDQGHFRGIHAEGGRQLSGVEQAAGVGMDPMDMMETSDEGEE